MRNLTSISRIEKLNISELSINLTSISPSPVHSAPSHPFLLQSMKLSLLEPSSLVPKLVESISHIAPGMCQYLDILNSEHATSSKLPFYKDTSCDQLRPKKANVTESSKTGSTKKPPHVSNLRPDLSPPAMDETPTDDSRGEINSVVITPAGGHFQQLSHVMLHPEILDVDSSEILNKMALSSLGHTVAGVSVKEYSKKVKVKKEPKDPSVAVDDHVELGMSSFLEIQESMSDVSI